MKWIVLFLLTLSISVKAQAERDVLITNKHIKTIYKQMIETIEFIDAEAIAVRNNTKTITWKTYKKHHKKKFRKARNSKDLKEAFISFADGFVNGHSHFDYLHSREEKEKVSSNIKVGYTFPNTVFFDLESKKSIKKINGKSIKKTFSYFENFQSSDNSTVGSQRSFKKKFENGTLKVKGKRPEVITFSDGSKKKIKYNHVNQEESLYAKYAEGLNIGNYTDWKKIAIAYKATLLQKENVALIKIKDFIYFKGHGGSIKCEEEARDSTMCSDVQILKKGLQSISNNTDILIFDLQGNNGGMENTPFIKMFSPSAFYDLRVQYKKTHLLRNDSIRPYLNYNSERGEAWFQEILANDIYKQTKDGDFLPSRADFCKGDEKCALKEIQPNDKFTSKFKKIIILVNEGTASSADDFAYRMNTHKNVYVTGQPQAADLTYSLITVVFYLDENNTIKKMYVGNRQREYKVPGKEILKFDIPYSKTVDKDGNMLQGNPLKLDLLVPITKTNFETREKNTLEEAINFFK